MIISIIPLTKDTTTAIARTSVTAINSHLITTELLQNTTAAFAVISKRFKLLYITNITAAIVTCVISKTPTVTISIYYKIYCCFLQKLTKDICYEII